jgi:hypothetical protein
MQAWAGDFILGEEDGYGTEPLCRASQPGA